MKHSPYRDVVTATTYDHLAQPYQFAAPARDLVHMLRLPVGCRVLDRSSDGKVLCKLSDFGLARTEDTVNTFTNRPGGTPIYMSPDAINGDPFGIEDDIYSLAVSVGELVTGKPNRKIEIATNETDANKKSLLMLLRNILMRGRGTRPRLEQIILMCRRWMS